MRFDFRVRTREKPSFQVSRAARTGFPQALGAREGGPRRDDYVHGTDALGGRRRRRRRRRVRVHHVHWSDGRARGGQRDVLELPLDLCACEPRAVIARTGNWSWTVGVFVRSVARTCSTRVNLLEPLREQLERVVQRVLAAPAVHLVCKVFSLHAPHFYCAL